MHDTNRKCCCRQSLELLWFSEIVAVLWENEGWSKSGHKALVSYPELSTPQISASSQAAVGFLTFFLRNEKFKLRILYC